MKKTRKRSISKDRSFSRLNGPGSAADEMLVLAELRATRDDPVFTVTPLDNLPDDEDAIDRLLVVSGVEKPITSIVQVEDMTSRTSAEQIEVLPDAAADRAQAAAYRVVPLAATQPPSEAEAEPELSGVTLKIASHDADGVVETQAFFFSVTEPKPEPGGQTLVSPVEDRPMATAPDLWAAGMADSPLRVEPIFETASIEEADTPTMVEVAAETGVAMPVPLIDDELANPLGLAVDRPMATAPDLWAAGMADSPLRVEPIFEPVPIEEADTPPGLEVAAETGVMMSALDDAAKPLVSDDGLPHSDPSVVVVSPPAATSGTERCEYKTEQARINTITLILSIVASLSALVLYFLLMDMKNDVLKLNEMVEIMKEDIQIKRDEPPAE
ncbi:hypothetical protein KFZ76_14005 [Methylovulum psychrotolerans]|uniref:hypothetical protein n=1 Tax=Methylovulum psychrotolerans TaxID=1704499 RepID=UPI001BFF0F83|nr:hypothetical protein [Methylovulum psychrotolerans]MBT9098819.1 hypothetical protein [Methylovulum psychrotolerans]